MFSWSYHNFKEVIKKRGLQFPNMATRIGMGCKNCFPLSITFLSILAFPVLWYGWVKGRTELKEKDANIHARTKKTYSIIIIDTYAKKNILFKTNCIQKKITRINKYKYGGRRDKWRNIFWMKGFYLKTLYICRWKRFNREINLGKCTYFFLLFLFCFPLHHLKSVFHIYLFF